MTVDYPVSNLDIDRSAAAMRAFWRLLVALVAALPVLLWQTDWKLLWLSDRASALAIGTLYLVAVVCTIACAVAALRWLMLAFWIGPLKIQVTSDRISMKLGPFGRRDCDWRDIKIDMAEGIDPELVELLPDDAFFPRLIDTRTGEDLAGTILRYGALDQESLTRALRPFLRDIGKNAHSARTSE
jgi:hypothetical protein